MSYEPTNWKTGDVVTSAKLNKLENAVANGYLVVHKTSTETDEGVTLTLDRTFKDIYDTLEDGRIAVIMSTEELGDTSYLNVNFISRVEISAEQAIYNVYVFDSDAVFGCSTIDGFPSYTFIKITPGGGGINPGPTT